MDSMVRPGGRLKTCLLSPITVQAWWREPFMSGELEKIIPALSDAALLDMIESDPVFYLPEALALAHATIEARGGRTVLQIRVSDASHKFCWSCRAERPPAARFCPECGAPLKLQPQSDSPAVPTTNPESTAAPPPDDPSNAAGDAAPSPEIGAKSEAETVLEASAPSEFADPPAVEPPAAEAASTDLDLAAALTLVQKTTPPEAAGSTETAAPPEVLAAPSTDEPEPSLEPVAEKVADPAESASEVALPASPVDATADVVPSPKAESEPNGSTESVATPPVKPAAELENVEPLKPVQGTAIAGAESSTETAAPAEVLAAPSTNEPVPALEPVMDQAQSTSEVALPASPVDATTDVVSSPKAETEPNASTASADLPSVKPAAEPENVEPLTSVQETPIAEAAGSTETAAPAEVLAAPSTDEPVPALEPVAEKVADPAESTTEVALPASPVDATADVVPSPKAESEPNASTESAATPPVKPAAELENVEPLKPVQGTATSGSAVADTSSTHATQAQVSSAVAVPPVAPEVAPVAKSVSDESSSTGASPTNLPAATPEASPSALVPSLTPDARSSAVASEVAKAADPTPEDILASVMAASGQAEPEPVVPIESVVKAGAEATMAAVVVEAMSTSPVDSPALESGVEHAATATALPSPDVAVPTGDGSASPEESPTEAVPAETKEAAAPNRPTPTLAARGRRPTKPKLVRALAAGGVLAALVLAGTLVRPYLPGRSPSHPAVAVHARARLTEPFLSALERCKSEYDASAGVVRRELTESIGVRGREAGGSMGVRLVRLRGKHVGRIARAREALREAEAALGTMGASPGFPASIAADFDKFSQIIARNERFFSATAPEAGFDQWYNDHPRMQAIYGRLRKAAARFDDAKQSGAPSAQPVNHEQH